MRAPPWAQHRRQVRALAGSAGPSRCFMSSLSCGSAHLRFHACCAHGSAAGRAIGPPAAAPSTDLSACSASLPAGALQRGAASVAADLA